MTRLAPCSYQMVHAQRLERPRPANPRLKLKTVEDFSGAMGKMQLPKPPNLGEVLQTNQRCLE